MALIWVSAWQGSTVMVLFMTQVTTLPKHGLVVLLLSKGHMFFCLHKAEWAQKAAFMPAQLLFQTFKKVTQ